MKHFSGNLIATALLNQITAGVSEGRVPAREELAKPVQAFRDAEELVALSALAPLSVKDQQALSALVTRVCSGATTPVFAQTLQGILIGHRTLR